MNFKLILQLSMFGLIMAFATVSLIPKNIEPIFWLVIIVFCAYAIAKVCTGKYFLHGFLLSMFNSLWITAAHLSFFSLYISNHPEVGAMTNDMGYFSVHPRLAMLGLAIPFGAGFGLIQGLLAFIASKIVKPKAAAIN